MADVISSNLMPYLPPAFLQGGELKPGITVAEATKIAQGIQAKAAALPEAQSKLFLEMIKSPDLAPGGSIPENIGAAIDQLAAVLDRLGPGTPIEDNLSVLARIMVEQAADSRKNALQDRVNARNMAKEELKAQADSLSNQAKELKDGAKSALITSIVFSAVSIVASAISIGGGVKAAGLSEGASSGFANSAQPVKSMSETFGQVGQAGSGYASTDAQASAKQMESQGQIAAASAQELQNLADLKKEMQDSMSDMIKSIINFLKEMSDAKAQQMQALTRV